MPIKTLRDLDLYLTMDQTKMKAIDANYSVRVGYWALRNHVHVYKVYAIVRQMFNPHSMNNLRQTLGNNLWLVVGQTNEPQL